MAKFTPRKTAPNKNNENYYSDKNIFYACGYGMPNCTAYAWGRLLELTGKSYDKLCGNAEDWWAVAEKAGLKRGNTPKLGAIVCFRAGKVKNNSDGAGHVCVVEEIKSNGDIVVSNSAWKGTEFYLMTLTKASGYVYDASRPLQGFIYCGIEFESGTSSSTSSANNTIKAGQKITLKNTKCYRTAYAANETMIRSGIYWLWSDEVVNGRVKITNKAERVGVSGQVTAWIKVADFVVDNKKEIKIGDKVKVLNPINYDTGKTFKLWYKEYEVMRLSGDRAVIGVNGVITSAISVNRLEKI